MKQLPVDNMIISGVSKKYSSSYLLLCFIFSSTIISAVFSSLEGYAVHSLQSQNSNLFLLILYVAVNLTVEILFFIFSRFVNPIRKLIEKGAVSVMLGVLCAFDSFAVLLFILNLHLPYRSLHPVSIFMDLFLFLFSMLLGYAIYAILSFAGRRIPINPRTSVFAMIFSVVIIVAVGILYSESSVKTSEATGASPPGTPNVIFIMIDSLRTDRLHAYGNPRELSPVIDSFRNNSVSFDKSFTQASWTKPSVASIFTGLTPSQHQVDDKEAFLPNDLLTYNEILQNYGYGTAAFSSNPFITKTFGFDHGFDDFYPSSFQFSKTIFGYIWMAGLEIISPRDSRILAETIFNKVEGWIEAREKRPFYVYIHLMDLHFPYNAPYPYSTKFIADDAPFKTYIQARQFMTEITNTEFFFYDDIHLEMTDPGLEAVRALYDGEVAYLDKQLGDFFDFLKSKQLFDDSIIIVTGDHGEDFGDHRHFTHGTTLYNTLVNVPVMIRFPNGEYSRIIEEHISSFDVFPTIMQYIGVPEPEDRQAVSIMDAIKTNQFVSSVPIFSDCSVGENVLQSVIVDNWKLISSKNKKTHIINNELYNLGKDFEEKHNVYSENSEIVEMLNGYIGENNEANRSVKRHKVEIDERTKKSLKDLGYLN